MKNSQQNSSQNSQQNLQQNDSPLFDVRIGKVTHQWAQTQKIKSYFSEKIESTNNQAKLDAFSEDALGENLMLYITDQQTAGRGRGQNTWSQAALGSQLLSTWSVMMEEVPQPTLSPQIGFALYRAALATWPFLDWNLKAPNDLYLGSKKIAGLLLETISQGDDIRLLIGLGFNVIAAPQDVTTATCLIDELPPNTPLLAEDWLSFLERLLFEFVFAIQLAHEPLNSTTQTGLLHALNQHPLLKEKYLLVDKHANLKTTSQSIAWSQL